MAVDAARIGRPSARESIADFIFFIDPVTSLNYGILFEHALYVTSIAQQEWPQQYMWSGWLKRDHEEIRRMTLVLWLNWSPRSLKRASKRW